MAIMYGKLVRDKIPAIIEADGKVAETRILDENAYREALEKKLDEEVAEFHASGDVEELADILEVVYALAAAKGVREWELSEKRLAKRNERGGFDQRIYLIATKEKA